MKNSTPEERLAWWLSRPPSPTRDDRIRSLRRTIRQNNREVARFRAELDTLNTATEEGT